jgi:hypothetical protein
MELTPFSTLELEALARHEGRPLISLLTPMHSAGRDRREDPIRFRNLMREAEGELKESGASAQEVDALLAPARELLAGREFWGAGHSAAAMFLAKDFVRLYTPPVSLPQQMIVGERFEVSPLLPALADGGPFYLLALAGNGWRLLQCTRWACVRMDIPGAPANEEEALAVFEPTPSLQHHTADRQAGERTGMLHGQGVGVDDRKDKLELYYRQLDHALCRRLQGLPGPLVVAATESRFAVYRSLSNHPDIVPQPAPGAPDVVADGALREVAWTLVAERYDAARRRARDLYQELVSKGRATASLPEAVAAADDGRVEALFARAGPPVWGRRLNGEVEVHSERQPGDIDLLNEAVALALLRDSAAYLTPADEMPGGDGDVVNAVLRW